MKIMVINGPNINFLGIRDTSIYGDTNYNGLVKLIQKHCREIEVEVELFQSNHEGGIIDQLQKCYHEDFDGVVINPGAYTHYSYAIRDAISSINLPVVEIHISNIYEREDFRQISVTKEVCIDQISGKGLDGYLEAIDFLVQYIDEVKES